MAYWSAHHTRYDFGPDGKATRYQPNVWIGAGVFGLFVLRLLWKLWSLLSGQADWAAQGSQGFDPSALAGSSPLTTALFALFAAYQIAYALLVLRAAKGQQA